MASPFPQADSPPFLPHRHAAHHHDWPVSIVGLAFVVAGCVLQLVALLETTWVKGTVGKRSIELGFADFGSRTERGLAYMFFSWGAWALFGLTLVLGVAACVRWHVARQFRIAGALAGVTGAVLAIAAVLVFAYQSHADVFQVARNYTLGPYLEVLGLLATAFGAAAGGIGTGTVGVRR